MHFRRWQWAKTLPIDATYARWPASGVIDLEVKAAPFGVLTICRPPPQLDLPVTLSGQPRRAAWSFKRPAKNECLQHTHPIPLDAV